MTSTLRYLFFLIPILSIGQSGKQPDLPEPFHTKSITNYSNVIGWKDGQTPVAPQGFTVTKFADGFDNPRWMHVLPNGDVLVAESNSNYSIPKQIGATVIGAAKSKEVAKSADKIRILRDRDGDGNPEINELFLDRDLNQPFGMLLMGKWLYVANTDALVRFPYVDGQLKMEGAMQKLVDLPAGKINQHWTRNIIANQEQTKIYIAVGCGTNIGEKGLENEIMRATILEVNPDGSGLKVFASGLRNPVGMDWEPKSKTLWTAVNERDGLGNDLVPDYLTSVHQNEFFGWPYTYWGNNADPRVKEKNPELSKKVQVPDVDLGAHTASLGLLFYTGKSFPAKYNSGAFVAQHGSWNRKPLSGYKVVFVPFKDGKPASKPEDFLTGFIVDSEKDEVRGRPTGLAQTKDGALLLTDDTTNTIWRISYKP